MKKIALIIVIIIFSLTAKAQHFGVSVDVGMSRINKIYNTYGTFENKSKIYYGLGVFYAKIPLESKWGFRATLDYNKRGAGALGEWYDWYGINPEYIVSETTESTKSLNLTFTPTLNASNRLQFFLGPTIGYTLGTNTKTITTYYKTEAKSEVLSSRTGTSEFNGSSFINRLHFGVKAGVNMKLSNRIDLGLTYQYARLLKYGNPNYQPFYNIVNFTTNIYFKKRENNVSEN
ncbi:MAG: hypothetical protein COB15_16950 [Flavobacteriales bacterium]|nr:MAG: hypothetical protein COB15_16950 [Flavobacteriales bacterium]